jgi:hypothetical protein
MAFDTYPNPDDTEQQLLRKATALLYLIGGGTTINGGVPTSNTVTGGLADAGPAWTTVRGVSGVPYTSANRSGGLASVTDAPVTGQKLVIDDLIVSVDTAMSVTFKEETSGNPVVHGPFYMPANSVLQVTLRGKTKLSTANKKLQVITSAAGNIMVEATYHSEA